MQEFKSLHDYTEIEFPDLIKRILMGQVKLFALISADETTYFVPKDDTETIREAKSGRYEIYKTAPVVSELEEIHSSEFDPDPLVNTIPYKIRLSEFTSDPRAYRIPYKIKLKWFISPEGKRGVLGRGSELSPADSLDPIVIPFSRILVEDNPVRSQLSSCGITTPEEPELKPETHTRYDLIKTLMMRYLDRTNGKGDFRGCIEFLLDDPEVDDSGEGKILWTSYSGKPQGATRKTMQNRFGECKKAWKQPIQ